MTEFAMDPGSLANAQKIVDLESNLERAAMLGKQLLEQLSVKSEENEELQENLIRLEMANDALKQQVFHAERAAESASIRERNTLEELSLHKEMNPDLTETNRRLQERVNHLQLETERKTQTMTEFEAEIDHLKTELAIVQNRLESLHSDSVKVQQERNDAKASNGDEDKIAEYQERIDTLANDLTITQTDYKVLHELHEASTRENHSLKRSLDEFKQKATELEGKLDFEKSMVEEKQGQIAELKEQIEQLEADQFDLKRRGNSIFAEVEDRRLQVESQFTELKLRLQSAETGRRRLKAQLSQCYSSMQTMASHTTKSQLNYVQTLETEIVRLREELDVCSFRLPMNNCASVNNESAGSDFTDSELQNNPLAGLLSTERKRVDTLGKKLSQLLDQESRRTQQIVRLGAELRNAQAVVERLSNQQAILLMKLQGASPDGNQPEAAGLAADSSQREVLQEVVDHIHRPLPSEKLPIERSYVDQSSRPIVAEKVETMDKENTESVPKRVGFAEGEPSNPHATADKPKRQPQGRKVTVLKPTSGASSNQANDCKTQ